MLIAVATWANVMADGEMLRITRGTVNDYLPLDAIDSMYFSADGKTMFFMTNTADTAIAMVRSTIGSIECVTQDVCPARITVAYNGNEAIVENPYFLSGVTAEADGAYVTVTNTNTSEELTTELSGTTTDGAFTYEGEYKTTIVLNAVTITSQRGAAIDIQCGKRIAMELKKGTVNTLTDAANGSQKAALYCKGHLEIDKAGTLNVTGNTAHAISAKEYIQLKKADGAINIFSALNDGIHCKQYFLANGYTVMIANVGGDGIQAELSGDEHYAEDYADGSLNIQGGTFSITCDGDDAGGLKADGDVNINSVKSVPVINITMNGAASKGIKADGVLNIEAGDITITNNGTGGTFDNEVYTSKCLSSDTDIKLTGGNIRLTATGNGGKCAKADGSIYLGSQTAPNALTLTAATTGGSYSGSTTGTSTGGSSWGGNRPGGGGMFPGRPGGSQDGQSDGTSSPKALKAVKNIIVYGGNTTTTTKGTGGEGWEGKTGVTVSGGNHYLKCYDDCINAGGIINFVGGNTVCYATNNDAVDSNYGRTGAITISGGNVFAYTSAGSPEEGFDCDNNSYITITGGIAVSAGGSQGGGGGFGGSSSSASVGSAAQGYYLGSSPSSYNTSYYYTLCNTSGTPVCTYKFEGSVSNTLSLLTASNLGKGSITVKTGTAEPTSCSAKVLSTMGKGVFYIAPTVITTSTATTVTAK